MAWDSVAPLNAIIALWQAVPTVQSVVMGSPESFTHRVSVYVTGGRRIPTDRNTGTLQRELRYFCGVGYRVKGAEAAAESAALASLDTFELAFYSSGNPRRTLNGTVDTAKLESVATDEPLYQVLAGVEYRIYPMIIVTTQQYVVGA